MLSHPRRLELELELLVLLVLLVMEVETLVLLVRVMLLEVEVVLKKGAGRLLVIATDKVWMNTALYSKNNSRYESYLMKKYIEVPSNMCHV